MDESRGFRGVLGPAAWLVWRGIHQDLTADPIKYITHFTGDWILRFLVITLAITPLRKILHVPQLIRFRRMFGLFAFFYAFLHFSTWIGLDQTFNWTAMWADVMKRPFITVGFTGFVLLIPLALTSTADGFVAWWKTLADAASADLCDRCLRRNSLLLVGEIGCSQATRVCFPRRSFAGMEDWLVAHSTTKTYGAPNDRSPGTSYRRICPAVGYN